MSTTALRLHARQRTAVGLGVGVLACVLAWTSSAAGAAAAKLVNTQACTLVTLPEAVKVMGKPLKRKPHIDGNQSLYCHYNATTGLGHLDVSINPDCGLLLLALDKNLFGPTQQRIKGIGDGGLLNKGRGNVQIAKGKACFTISAGEGTRNVADAVMLAMAKTAAGRTS